MRKAELLMDFSEDYNSFKKGVVLVLENGVYKTGLNGFGGCSSLPMYLVENNPLIFRVFEEDEVKEIKEITPTEMSETMSIEEQMEIIRLKINEIIKQIKSDTKRINSLEGKSSY